MSNELIDIDERAGTFTSVSVRFRGQEYCLAGTALQLIEAAAVQAKVTKAEDESNVAYALRMVRPMLQAVSPEIAKVIAEKDLSANEELAFIPVLTEVVKRIGAIRFH